ncbi:condensation domain-containing protein, partial [Corynebacterium bovis]|uniref:condensation domain-containing protein n=1 Tax=Corynebacterium bovis TaxID=36808 RepID=UPI00313990D9
MLRTTISWVDGRIADDRIDLLLRLWDEALREVAAVADHATLSPGDVHPAPVTQADLEDLASPGLVDVLPLTPLQHGMYFHSVFDDSPSTYVEQQIIHLGPDAEADAAAGAAPDATPAATVLDVDRFRAAARALLRRHPALCTRAVETAEGYVVAALDTGTADDLAVTVVEAGEVSGEGFDAALDRIAREDLDRGIPVTDAPLMRWTVVRTPAAAGHPDARARVALVQTVHHLIADGWSVPVMLRDLFDLYRADDRSPTAGLRRHDPHAGAAGLVRWAADRDHASDLATWRAELDGARPVVLSSRDPEAGERRELVVDDPRTAGLADRARDAGAGTADVVHAAWGAVLRAVTGHAPGEAVVFGSTVSGRDVPVPGVTDAVGMMINTVPVVAGGAGPTAPASELVRVVAGHTNRVRDLQYVGLTDICRAAGTTAGELLDTLAVVEVALDPAEVSRPGTGFTVTRLANNGAPHFPLSLVVDPSAERPLRIIHDPAVVGDVRARRIARMLGSAVAAVLGDGRSAGELAADLAGVSGPGEGDDAHLPAGDAASPDADDALPGTLAGVWRRSVAAYPGRPAVSVVDAGGADDGDGTGGASGGTGGADGAGGDCVTVTGGPVDYAALDRRARALAGRLRDRLAATDAGAATCGDAGAADADADADARATGTAGPRVVLLMDRGVDHVAAILAVTLLGGTYVPVDPTSPEDRLALIVGDCRPDAVIATADHRDLARDLLVHAGRGERPVVVPDAGDEATRAD